MIKLKRAYDGATSEDGLRVLVERLWPRGVSKQKAQIDLWLKELAPSTELRQWYGHDRARWPQFQKRYRAELKAHAGLVALLQIVAQARTVTFIYAASDEERNSAIVLKEWVARCQRNELPALNAGTPFANSMPHSSRDRFSAFMSIFDL
jgi:uncharacterized protein YeaO (DUF488 family)